MGRDALDVAAVLAARPGDLGVLEQIARATMDHARRIAGRTEAVVVLFEQRDPHSAKGTVAGNAGSVDAATDHDDIVALHGVRFIEPKPNVFVGTVNKRTREKTIEYIRRNAPELGILIIATDNSSQGFFIKKYGKTKRNIARQTGLFLIAEKWQEENNET